MGHQIKKSHKLDIGFQIEIYRKNGNVEIVKPLQNGSRDENTIELTTVNSQKEIIDYKIAPFRSYTNNFMAILGYQFHGDFDLNFSTRDTGANIITPTASSGFYFRTGIADEGSYGILLGTGSTDVTLDDYGLLSPLPQGTGSNTLSYGLSTASLIHTPGTSYKVQVGREVTNNSGASLTIREEGIVTRTSPTGSSTQAFMVARDNYDKSGAAVTVNLSNGQSVEVRHNFYFNTSEGFTKPFAEWFYSHANVVSFPATGSTHDVDDALLSFNMTDPVLLINAAAGDATYGIVVGSSNTALDETNYALVAPIDHGANAGELNYGIMEFESPVVDNVSSTQTKITISRLFTNDYVSNITIREAGINCIGKTAQRFNILRRLTSDILIAPSESFRIKFTYQISSAD
jgi:hypothetical protein